MTTRRWIVVVAMVALMLGAGVWLKRRRDYFLSLVQSHQNEVASFITRGQALKARLGSTSGMTSEEIMRMYSAFDRMMDRADHHASLARKYEDAARRPWVPVAPDAPEP
jgi:hypothetical protein